MVAGTQVGAYRVLQQIGEGGMGTVWLAEHVLLRRRAAIKLLHPMFTARPDVVTRFFNEARAATAISDPGIVQIFDFGHHVDGSAYIAMEMLEGEPLDKRLHRLGKLPIADALRIMRQVASTLGVAHLRGIVHRDLKPENIYLVRDPEVVGGERAKILDFGIAKLTGDSGIKTHTSAMMGTPAYMSPEQCRGAGQVDQRSDVYALGCMLFTLMAGAPPFDGEGAGEIIAMHLREPPPALSSRVHGIPPNLEALVMHCLAKEPLQRYASATELAAAIGGVLGTHSSANLQAAGAAAPGMAMAAGSATTLSATAGVVTAAGSHRSMRGGVLVVAGMLVAGGGITAVAVTRSDGAREATMSARAPTAPATAKPPLPAVAASVLPAPTAVPQSRTDPTARLAEQMKTVLTSFVAWSHEHAGAPCPSLSELGLEVRDPWGHSIELTCTDQPANQMIGAISAGPDGTLGTPDDVGSWQLGRDVANVVDGARWIAAKTSPLVKPTKPAKSATRSATPSTDDNDIPVER